MATDTTKQVIQEVAAQAGRQEEKMVETIQLVSFELDKEEFASRIGDLREIIKMREIVPIPGAPSFIAGILNVRGQIVIVVDLEKRFSLRREHETAPQHIIIVEVENTVFGILVDEVTGVLRVPLTSIKQTPGIITSKIHADYLKGVVVLEGETLKRPAGTEEPTGGKGGQKSEGKVEAAETTTRLLLLLDIPKMLSEKELQQFGTVIQETVKETAKVAESK